MIFLPYVILCVMVDIFPIDKRLNVYGHFAAAECINMHLVFFPIDVCRALFGQIFMDILQLLDVYGCI